MFNERFLMRLQQAEGVTKDLLFMLRRVKENREAEEWMAFINVGRAGSS